MRGLITDPSRISDALYRDFVQQAQLTGWLTDHLVRGEPYLALNAVVLEADENCLLAGLTETFAVIFDRAARAVMGNVSTLVELGFPWPAAELLSAETPRLPILGRFDFVQDRLGHWWLLEYNADTPSGLREAVAVEACVQSALPEARELGRPTGRLGELLVTAFGRATEGLARSHALGIVVDAAELEDLAQMAFTACLIADTLEKQGVATVLGDVDNLVATRQGLSLMGRPIEALYRYVAFESAFGTPLFAAIYEAVADGRLRLLNGLFGLLLQNKGLLAWVWRHRTDAIYSAAERAAIERHLAPTWPIDAYPEQADRSSLVAKQVFGREGEEVFFGEDLNAEAWDEVRRRRSYVAQRRVDVGELTAVIPTWGGAERRVGRVTVGGYVVAGKWAGYYTRFGDKIITNRAKWLATFVEEEGRHGESSLGKRSY